MAKWLLVDGFNLVYRCFFAIPELTRSDGLPTNALHGWVKSLWMLTDQEKPDGTLVFFDLGGARTGWRCIRNTRRNARKCPRRW